MTNNNNKLFTTDDFLSGKKFDYIVYVDRPELNFYYQSKTGLIMQGKKVIGRASIFKTDVFQVDIWILGGFSVRYLRIENCKHSKSGFSLINSINKLKLSIHV